MSGTGQQPYGGHLGTATPLNPGDPRRVGRYALLGRLGAGGMGTVYLGRRAETATAQLVAVKVVHRELAGDAAFRARLADEVAAARRVAPFCTARVLDADPAADPPYLVTEYIDGVPLGRAIADRGPLDRSTLQGVALGVAAALTAIHAAGVVHRDLKPGNVLLSLSGPRVIDFGIARALDVTVGRTLAGTILGTPGWMAPEQFLGGAVEPAADVFSWGSLIAYAATGRSPWGTEGPPAALAYRIIHQEADLSGLDGSLLPLVEAALRKQPSQRPTARDLVLSLLGTGGSSGWRADDPTLAATRLLQRSWSGLSAMASFGSGGGSAHQAPGQGLGVDGRRSGADGQPADQSHRASDLLRRGGLIARGLLGPPRRPRDPDPTRPAGSRRPTRTTTAPPEATTIVLQPRTTVLPPRPTRQDHHAGPAGGSPDPPPRSARVGQRAPSHPSGSSSPPHQRAGSERRPRRWYQKKRYLLLLVLLSLLIVKLSDAHVPGEGSSAQPGSTTTRTSGPTAETRRQVGVPVRDGQLEFLLRRWRCGILSVGAGQSVRPTRGQYCLADLTVRNIGTEQRRLTEPQLALQDTDGQWYPADTTARLYMGKQSLWNTVYPGETVTGTAAFDIPRSSHAARIELHDSLFSDGIQLVI